MVVELGFGTRIKIGALERPLDLINQLKGKNIIVKLQDGKEISGVLVAWDIHINVVLEINKVLTFIRGDNILSIS